MIRKLIFMFLMFPMVGFTQSCSKIENNTLLEYDISIKAETLKTKDINEIIASPICDIEFVKMSFQNGWFKIYFVHKRESIGILEITSKNEKIILMIDQRKIINKKINGKVHLYYDNYNHELPFLYCKINKIKYRGGSKSIVKTKMINTRKYNKLKTKSCLRVNS